MTFLALIGQKTPFYYALKRILLGTGISSEFINENISPNELIAKEFDNILIIINTTNDTISQVRELIWKKLRLNKNQIDNKIARLPVLVIGFDKHFLITIEGKVFRDFPVHHQYIVKPLNLYKFLIVLSKLSPIEPDSLCIINEDAPESILSVLEHDLNNISKKFNYSGSNKDVRQRLKQIEIDLMNYKLLQKKNNKFRKVIEEVKILKKEIKKRKGDG